MEKKTNIPDSELLVHKIGNCISASLKPTDYFVGYAPFFFQFVIEEYKGETLFSEKITPIEQAIVGILTIDETASIEKIGTVLGFNVMQDVAEYNILSDAIKLLIRHKVIAGDDSMYCLTEEGKVFATEGKRPEKDTYNFKLWYSKTYPQITSLKEILDADNIVEEVQSSTENSVDLDIIRNVAAKQAPKVHNPSDERLLSKVELINSSSYNYTLYVCFIRDVFTGEIKAIAYDESQDTILDDFSNLIDNNDALKAQLFDSIVESVFIPEEAQVNELEIVKEAAENEIEIDVTDNNGIQKLHKKALYDEIAFENELNQIFNADQPDEVWLISPWIGYYFVQYRVPMIEKVLKEGAKVFIAYSKKDPRDKNHSEMVNSLAQKEIDRLSETYSCFYCVELPKIFHTKNVLEVKNDQVIMFSGSFNILSFAIQENHKVIRGEQMAFVNPQKAKSEYRSYVELFASIYVASFNNELSGESHLNNNKQGYDRLNYFLSKSVMKEEISDLLDSLDKKMFEKQKTEWVDKVHKLQKMISPLLIRGIVTAKDRKFFLKTITDLDESAKLLSLDQETAQLTKVIYDHVMNLRIGKNAIAAIDENGKKVSKDHRDHSEDIIKIYEKEPSGLITYEDLNYARQIFKSGKISNVHLIIRLLASLNLIVSAIKKGKEKRITFNDINMKIIEIIKKSADKYPEMSIFTKGDSTIIDLFGLQFSFYKVSHTEETKMIISQRQNKTVELNHQKNHLYANEVFRLIIND